MNKNKIFSALIIFLSLIVILTGCGGNNGDNQLSTYIIGGTVSINEGNVEDVILKVTGSQGTSIVYPETNGTWNKVVSQGNITVTPIYDSDGDNKNDYTFEPSVWTGYVNERKNNIDFTGTYTSYLMAQKMLGEWKFTYNISTTTYSEYYIFNGTTKDEEDGHYYAYGYKEKEYSSTFGYTYYGPNYLAVSSYDEEEKNYALLGESELIDSFFIFDFNSPTTVTGDYFMVVDDELMPPNDMTGEKIGSINSVQSINNISSNKETEGLFEKLNVKTKQNKMISFITNEKNDNKKIDMKKKEFEK